ncbi:unnamed protein product [Boreogadus saida]
MNHDMEEKGIVGRECIPLEPCFPPPRQRVCGGSSRQSRTQLSTDEKVKRAFFISQTQQDLYSSVLDVLTPEDVCVLAQSEDEFGRRGDFERIFPSSSSSHYLRFFECRRYLNILLSQWEHRYASNRNTVQKGVPYAKEIKWLFLEPEAFSL